MTDFPTLSYKPEKGIPFGRSLAPRKHGTWGLMPAGTPEVVNR